jgi:hypothetical protein
VSAYARFPTRNRWEYRTSGTSHWNYDLPFGATTGSESLHVRQRGKIRSHTVRTTPSTASDSRTICEMRKEICDLLGTFGNGNSQILRGRHRPARVFYDSFLRGWRTTTVRHPRRRCVGICGRIQADATDLPKFSTRVFDVTVVVRWAITFTM